MEERGRYGSQAKRFAICGTSGPLTNRLTRDRKVQVWRMKMIGSIKGRRNYAASLEPMAERAADGRLGDEVTGGLRVMRHVYVFGLWTDIRPLSTQAECASSMLLTLPLRLAATET